MGILQKKAPIEKERELLLKRESKFLSARAGKEDSRLNLLLEAKVPPNLQVTLDAAFYRAFHLVFEKGTGVIEKTYHRERKEQAAQVNRYANQVSGSRKSFKTFSRGAAASSAAGVALSGASGIGMGLLGIGLPDIPVFTAMVLRTVYDIALGYGYGYDSQEERHFILLLIRAAVSHGDELVALDRQLNQFIRQPVLPEDYNRDEAIRAAAEALSGELLYMKFLQGIPIVGAVGGAYDVLYMKTITDYAKLKYHRRFLSGKR